MKKPIFLASMAVVGVALAASPAAYAATSSVSTTLSQTISAGTATTSIRDASGATASTTFNMSPVTVSTSQQTATGTYGGNTQRVTVDNPGSGSVNWTLTLSALSTDKWTSGTNNYPFNGTAATGQLTVNPASGSYTAVTGSSSGITLGSSTSYSGTTTLSATLATGASTASITNGYFTGIGLSQTIPASQPSGTYTLPMTQTLTTT